MFMPFLLAATLSTPSGLQIPMLFLFQIIAGLLLADLFKQAVEVLNKSRHVVNILLLFAGAAFLIRLLVENFIFYAATDTPPATISQYVLRILLLLIDLAAFAIGYDLVHQVSPSGLVGGNNVYSIDRARRVLWAMAGVEILHVGWGLLNVLLGVVRGETWQTVLIGSTNGTVAGRWLAISVVFALLPLPLISSIRRSNQAADLWVAVKVAGFSAASVLTYLVVMRDYYTGKLQ
jgi:hypothetical protein